MPELPEVVTVVNQLNKELTNKKVAFIKLYKEKMLKNSTLEELENSFKNEVILSVTNKGKFIVFHFSNDKILLSHLRMNGKYFLNNSARKEKHTYLVMGFQDASFLHYNDTRMFGTFHIKTQENFLKTPPLNQVALTPMEIDLEDLFLKLQKSSRYIKTTLLDQSVIAGLGNIYVDEVLFASKIHPLKKSNTLTKKQVELILKFSKSILLKSIELGGSTINSYASLNKQEGQFQNFLKVHTKKGFACPDCKNIIEKIVVGGRGTYICSKCQNEEK